MKHRNKTSQLLHLPLTAAFSNGELTLDLDSPHVGEDRGVWTIELKANESLVFELATPPALVALSSVESASGKQMWIAWSPTATGLRSPVYDEPEQVTLEISTAPADDTTAAARGTTATIVIRKEGRPDPVRR